MQDVSTPELFFFFGKFEHCSYMPYIGRQFRHTQLQNYLECVSGAAKRGITVTVHC
uniref:Uncharacterized protein n=1 Tax=Anguilla anguilla TaxID=7936 RepID=A0A0E9P8U4_ANGAN